MPQTPTVTEERAAYSDNVSLWQTQPLLEPQGQQYLGRVFAEVWDGEDAHLVVPNDTLRQTALAALRGEQSSERTAITLTNRPATGSVSGQTFLGRVIIEVWSNKTLVSVSGPEATVIERVIALLQD